MLKYDCNLQVTQKKYQEGAEQKIFGFFRIVLQSSGYQDYQLEKYSVKIN